MAINDIDVQENLIKIKGDSKQNIWIIHFSALGKKLCI